MGSSKCYVFLVTLLLVGMVSFAYAQEPAHFQGVWNMEDTGGLAFGLELYQDGETLSGHLCGMTTNASRIDCSLAGEDEISITGSIRGNVAKVRFTSAYSGQVGMAKLTLQEDSLLWEITAYPNGEYYLPDQAVLTKTDKTSEDMDIDDERMERLQALVNQKLQAGNYAYPVQFDDNYIAYTDLNNDGIEDLVTIFYAFDESIDTPDSEVRAEDRFLTVGFGTPDGDITLALNAQGVPCLDCGMYNEPEIALGAENGVISLASSGGSNWRWETTQKIRYEDDTFKVIGYTARSYHVGADVVFEYDGNLNTLEATREYAYAFGEDREGAVHFYHLMANRTATPLSIDGQMNESAWLFAQMTTIRQGSDVVYKPENWSGVSDLSFAAATLWDDNGLYLGLVVEDDRVIPVENWETILKGDHLELWLDFADSLVLWDDEGWPVRQKPDSQIMQIGIGVPEVGVGPVIRMLYPEPEGTLGIVAAVSPTQTGYTLEMAIPSLLFEMSAPAHDEWQWQPGLAFGLSIVVSDTDNPENRRQDCLMATSAVQWGNPYTFGVGSLVETYAKPDFPLTSWPARY